MKWSLKLGSFAGIAVNLHWSFLLLIGWIFLVHLGEGKTPVQAFAGVAFILALFVCVVLHEFGHALTARHFGVGTRDITLFPIGGVARLERIPDKPMQEFWVAIAGPAVNAVIAATLALALLVTGNAYQMAAAGVDDGSFVAKLIWLNIFIGTFNLLPAFPMDGGRVLRSLLAIRIGRRRATAIAANIGQAMAILFGMIGLFHFHNPFLIIIAIFVYLGAQGEADQVETEFALDGLRVHDAMMTRFRTLSPHDTLARAVEELLAGSQQDFPVVEDGQVMGLLRRNDLVQALTDGRDGSIVGEVMWRDCRQIDETDALTPTLEFMANNRCASLPVIQGRRIVGLLTLENIGELIMVKSALSSHPEDHLPGKGANDH
jgi:Zn-dependent protease/predicted transcriptional regulator